MLSKVYKNWILKLRKVVEYTNQNYENIKHSNFMFIFFKKKKKIGVKPLPIDTTFLYSASLHSVK